MTQDEATEKSKSLCGPRAEKMREVFPDTPAVLAGCQAED